MAFVPWKDRVTSTPHRYKLTEVSADTYDLTAVPGAISEAGTPVNAEHLDRLIQRDGDDIKDTVVAFVEAGTRANIATGESTATLFGKIKKYFSDLKTHAFTTPSASQGTGTTSVPSDNLLKQSSFARVYRSFADLNLASTATPEDVGAAMIDNSIAELDITSSNAPNIVPSYVGNQGCVVTFKRKTVNVTSVTLQTKSGNSTNSYFLTGSLRINDSSNKWSGWKKIKTGSLVSLGGTSATSGKYIRFASVSFTGTNKEVSGVFLVYDNNHWVAESNTCVLTLSCMTTSTTNSVKIGGVNIDQNILNEFYFSYNPTYSGDANTFDFYFKQTNQYSSIVVEFLSSSARNNATAMNPVQDYFDLELEYDSNGNLVTHDTIPSNGVVATFLSKVSTLPVYFPVSPLVPTTPSGPSSAVAKSYADLKVALAGAETITGIKTFATGATPLITDAPTTELMAVNKAYADGLVPYSKVIRTQAEFEALIASPTWLDAVSVALVGQFTLSTANNIGIKIPATVKQIHGFNNAKITVTDFAYDATTAKGGLWYNMLPMTKDYSIRDLEVDCTGTAIGYGFGNCTNLTNCTGKGTGSTGSTGYGFRLCENLMNCTGTGSGKYGGGFSYCDNVTNCTGTGTGSTNGTGFSACTNLTNCTGKGTGTGTASFGFSDIQYASNCKDGGSSTAMWGGTNRNIDVDTCCKTPVTANNTTLNT